MKKIEEIITEYINVLQKLLVGTGTIPKNIKLPKDLLTTSFEHGKFNINKIKSLALTDKQIKSLNYLKISATQNINNLEQKIKTDIISAFVQSDLLLIQGIKITAEMAVINTNSRYSVVQALRNMTDDWSHDWHRVAHTEMWNTKINGEVMELLGNKNKEQDIIVFKRPSPMACSQCKKLYLESDGITPKLFKLTEMLALGTNVGLKTEDWKAVVGTLHPNCMCPLSVMPNGFEFDEDGNIV